MWGDQGNERNVIIDAEALLSFLLPESAIARLSFYANDDGLVVKAAGMDAGMSLARISGDKYTVDLPEDSRQAILDLLLQFFEDNGGNLPTFAAGTYLDTIDKSLYDANVNKKNNGNISSVAADNTENLASLRRDVEVVDAYTYSVTVSLLTLQLVERWFPKTLESESEYGEIEKLKGMASARLTKAMEGLVDSFSVTAGQSVSSWESKTKRVWPKLNVELNEVRRRLKKIQKGLPTSGAFEIGWSWGPVTPEARFLQSDRSYQYAAANTPYLYFTVGALDGIRDIFSNEVQTSPLLNDNQRQLGQDLRLMSELTTMYWAALTFDDSGGGWAVEDIPWVTADGNTSEYWTLYLLRVTLSRISSSEHDSSRLIALAKELAQRARITRKPVPPESDPALKLHWPGEILNLYTADPLPDNNLLQWAVYDFSPQLLKLTGQLLERTCSPQDKAELADLIGQIWTHLRERRESSGPSIYTWDTFERVYGDWYDESIKEFHESHSRPESAVSSWYITERVIEALVAVALGATSRPLAPVAMREFLFELVSELDYRMAQEDSLPDAAHVEIQKRRIQIHDARSALLDHNASLCLELLTQVTSSEAAYRLSIRNR